MFKRTVDSVIKLLRESGINAVGSYPDKKADGGREVVCVSLGEAKLSPTARGNSGNTSGEEWEMYGCKAAISLLLTIYAPTSGKGPTRCLELAEEIRSALFDSLPGLSGFVCKDTSFCAESRMFVCRCTATFSSGDDIYLELNGKKIAAVQSYVAKSLREERLIEAFGENMPVASVFSAPIHRIDLTRLCTVNETINLRETDGFSLVIVKPDRRIVYSDCRWESIEESAMLGGNATERASIIARSRSESAV